MSEKLINNQNERGIVTRDKTEELERYPLCDKCNKPVPPTNNALLLEQFATGGVIIVDFDVLWEKIEIDNLANKHGRHLFPKADCEGSPSRLQYLEGQSKDERGYGYDPKKENAFRKAYQKMIQKFGKQ